MSKTYVETQTQVVERLQPPQVETASGSISWPVSSKINKGDQLLLFPSAMLLRSASFDRLRQVPAYVCSALSDLRWLFSSKSAFSQAIAASVKQLNALLLTISVYLAITVLILQLIALTAVLVNTSIIPLGLIFMCFCICVISAVSFTSISSLESIQKSKLH